MSSRRNLKKTINNSFGYLYEDCILYTVVQKNTNSKQYESLLEEMCKAHQDLISRLSVSERKGVKNRTKAYYKKLKDDFKNQINTFGNKLQALDQ